jgi:hypothetical protein
MICWFVEAVKDIDIPKICTYLKMLHKNGYKKG